MRVVAGSARGVRLRAPSSTGTRPISDRGKEALFNILAPLTPGALLLDLFAGTGGVGIEALSRGAERATFVELSPVALGDLRYNLERTRLAGRATVEHRDVFSYLGDEPAAFDIVFAAPPQWHDLWSRTVHLLDQRPGWLAPGAVLVTQCDPREDADLPLRNLSRYDTRRYGGVLFGFYERAGGSRADS